MNNDTVPHDLYLHHVLPHVDVAALFLLAATGHVMRRHVLAFLRVHTLEHLIHKDIPSDQLALADAALARRRLPDAPALTDAEMAVLLDIARLEILVQGWSWSPLKLIWEMRRREFVLALFGVHLSRGLMTALVPPRMLRGLVARAGVSQTELVAAFGKRLATLSVADARALAAQVAYLNVFRGVSDLDLLARTGRPEMLDPRLNTRPSMRKHAVESGSAAMVAALLDRPQADGNYLAQTPHVQRDLCLDAIAVPAMDVLEVLVRWCTPHRHRWPSYHVSTLFNVILSRNSSMETTLRTHALCVLAPLADQPTTEDRIASVVAALANRTAAVWDVLAATWGTACFPCALVRYRVNQERTRFDWRDDDETRQRKLDERTERNVAVVSWFQARGLWNEQELRELLAAWHTKRPLPAPGCQCKVHRAAAGLGLLADGHALEPLVPSTDTTRDTFRHFIEWAVAEAALTFP